jgi:hypothetical protein
MAIELTEEQKLQYNELMAAYAARVDDREWCRLVDRADPVVADAVEAHCSKDLAQAKARLAQKKAELAALPLRLRLYARVLRWWLRLRRWLRNR